MNTYQTLIAATLNEHGITIAPRIIEAWMRSEHGTLDNLSRARFGREVLICASVAMEAGDELNESLAGSFGL